MNLLFHGFVWSESPAKAPGCVLQDEQKSPKLRCLRTSVNQATRGGVTVFPWYPVFYVSLLKRIRQKVVVSR
jgi:hypothetical protein